MGRDSPFLVLVFYLHYKLALSLFFPTQILLAMKSKPLLIKLTSLPPIVINPQLPLFLSFFSFPFSLPSDRPLESALYVA